MRHEEMEASGLIRFLLEVPAPRASISGDALVRALREALVHENRIAELLAATGSSMQVDDLVALLADALEATGTRPVARLPEAEISEWRAAGVDVNSSRPGARDALVEAAVTYAGLVANALTTREAAELLGVEESRIRQRLLDGSLFGIKSDRTWRLPRMQFTHTGVVPGLSDVLRHVPRGMHAVALWRWLTTPSGDLVLDDEPVAPLDWLRAGGDPAPVSAVAAEL